MSLPTTPSAPAREPWRRRVQAAWLRWCAACERYWNDHPVHRYY